MNSNPTLGELILKFKERDGRSYQAISNLTAGQLSGRTIQNWVNLNVKRVRDWQSLVHFCLALTLNESESDELLQTGCGTSIRELQQTVTNEQERDLLTFWETPTVIFQAPREEPNFIGRELQKRFAKEALLNNDKILFLHGMGGVGKSTFASKIARELKSFFPDGVLWASIEGMLSISSVLLSFSSAYNQDISMFETETQRSEVVRRLLASKRCLVVLDNIVSLTELELLLPANGLCSVLITTRNKKVARSYGKRINLIPFDQSESKKLLRELISPQRVDHEIEQVDRLIYFVDGLPLALRIIGNTLKSNDEITLKNYADLIENEETRLAQIDKWHDYNRGIRAVFEVSYSLLPAHCQTLFANLSIFKARHFSSEAVISIQKNPDTTVESKLALGLLTDASMIQKRSLSVSEQVGGYQMHVLLHLFAQEKRDDDQAVWQRYGEYLSEFILKWAIGKIDDEWVNIQGCIEWALAHPDATFFNALISNLSFSEINYMGYLDKRGYWKKAYNWLLAINSQSLNSLEQSWNHLKLAVFAFRLGNIEGAIKHIKDIESNLNQISPSLQQALLVARLFDLKARLSRAQGEDKELGIDWLYKGIATLEKYQDQYSARLSMAMLHATLSTFWAWSGEFQRAIDSSDFALDILPQNVATRLGPMQNLGIIYTHLGELNKAISYFNKGHLLSAELGDKRQQANFLMNMGIVEQRRANLDVAINYQEKAGYIFYEIGDPDGEGSTYINRSMLSFILGDDAEVTNLLNKAIKLAEEWRLLELEAFSKTTLVKTKLRVGDLEEAKILLKRCHELCVTFEIANELRPSLLTMQAELAMREGQLVQAMKHVEYAIELASHGNYLQEEGVALGVKARLYAQMGKNEQSEDAFQQSVQKLEKEEPYELAKVQLAYGVHLKQTRHEQENLFIGQNLIEMACATFHQLGASHELNVCANIGLH